VKPLVLIAGRILGAPLVQRERRIGDHNIESEKLVVLDQLGVIEGVAASCMAILPSTSAA
jgi:hypothetical protein